MMEADYKEELSTIQYIGNCNGYSENLINRINTKIKNRIQRNNLTTLFEVTTNTKAFITVEYNRATSNIIKKHLHQYGYTVAYKTNHKLQQKIHTHQNKIEMESGVYKLVCNECAKYYIGQTGRSFSQRFKEHIDELRNTRTISNYKSNYAQHIATEKHTYTDLNTNLKVLHRMKKGSNLDRIEELEIYKQRNNPLLLNDKIHTKANKIYDVIIKNK